MADANSNEGNPSGGDQPMNGSQPLFARVARLFDAGSLRDARVLIAGCGSGGSQVALQLCMAGIHKFSIFDRDILEVPNVIRHACGGRYVGQKKVDALADVLCDRNSAVEIERFDVDIMTSAEVENAVRRSAVVVLATDNEPSRFRINQLWVDARTAFVLGRVFTRGIGGEVFAYRPGETGCLACIESVLQRSQFREGVSEVDLLSEEQREHLYGLDVGEIKDSPGLNVDISFITCFHARFAIDAICRTLPRRPQQLPSIETDCDLGKSTHSPVHQTF